MVRTKIDIVGTVHEVGFTNRTAIDDLKTLLKIFRKALDGKGDALLSGLESPVLRETDPDDTQYLLQEQTRSCGRKALISKWSGKLRETFYGGQL